MSAIFHLPRPANSNRRRRERQKVVAPMHARFDGASKGEILDPHEVLDISELGLSVRCPSVLEVNRQVDIRLDLAEFGEQISATARVVWSDSVGRVGFGFPALSDSALHHLREWLFLNATAGAPHVASPSETSLTATESSLRPNYANTLGATSAVQREAESLGTDLEAVLSLIALRARSLLRASGAAIALAGKDPGAMSCHASAGTSAPPVGTTLQVGSGFSGECILTGKMLRCDDTETDNLVDRQGCRALGIRSMLAVPLCSGEKVIGLIEVFSGQSSAFTEKDSAILQFFAEQIVGAVNRASRSDDFSGLAAFSSAWGSAPLSHEPPEGTGNGNPFANEANVGGLRPPRAHLYLLCGATLTVALLIGLMIVGIHQMRKARERGGRLSVLASLPPPVEASRPDPSLNSGEMEELRALARHGNPAAENAMGLLYAQGDARHAITQDQREAVRWFTRAAEHGSVPAQYKLGLLYWGGHGVPKDANKAYFWAVLARAGGQEGSQDLAKVLATDLTRAQAAAIEYQAEIWHLQYESRAKPESRR
ncbi:MAG: GAF domain-containing protein [Candidatus Sulfotelmatobacter sp.]